MINRAYKTDSRTSRRHLIKKEKWIPYEIEPIREAYTSNYFVIHIPNPTATKEKYKQITEWCKQNIGPENFVSTIKRGSYDVHNMQLAFRSKQDFVAFLLRWGNQDK
jgi:hypothetical protein